MRHLIRLLLIIPLAATLAGFPSSATVHASPRVLAGFPLLRQQHSLTCEASATSMGTRGIVSESRIMSLLPHNANPNLGFRGNPDGQPGTALVDYGVYASPIHQALGQLGYRSDVLMYANDGTLRSYIDRGWPVVAWVTYQLQRTVPRFAWYGGSQFFLVPHEHAVLLVGYDGRSVIANEPWLDIRVRYDWSNFNRAWGYFANMALAVEPCAAPLPVTMLRPTAISEDGISWSWQPAVRATSYHVRIVQHGETDQVVFQGTQTDTHVSYDTVLYGATYEIDVRSISACGALSSSQRLWSAVAQPPTPTPPTAESTVRPTKTPVPSVTITGTATTSATTTPTSKL